MIPPPGAAEVASRLAGLIGCDRAVLGPSTLHLFFDLFSILAEEPVAIWVDDGSYPIAGWMARAAGRGTPVSFFRHNQPDELQRRMGKNRRRPVVVCDGFCPSCGRMAPIGEYLESIRRSGGLLILDDTQALGISGQRPTPANPYGLGGGGSLSWSGVSAPDVVVVASLAKAFGAPLAVLAGERDRVRRFVRRSGTRVHCSPPSAAAIQAARHALAMNERQGDALRRRLQDLVTHFRRGLADEGLAAAGGMFPVQSLLAVPGLDVHTLHEGLLAANLRTVLKRAHPGPGAQIAFLLSAGHGPAEIDAATAILVRTVRATSHQRSKRCKAITSP